MEEKRYWYARGYHDARANGDRSCPEYLSEEDKQAYTSGYNRGFIDFVESDEERDEGNEQ